MKTASRLVVVVGAFCAVVAMANVSQATIIASDNFNRADGGTAADSLGNTEVGGYHWYERVLSGPNSSSGDVAHLTGTELATYDATLQIALNINVPDPTATATVRFTTTPSANSTAKSLGMILRESTMDSNFIADPNMGAVIAQITSAGGLLLGEKTTLGTFAWAYNGNTFTGGGDCQPYGAAGSLPTTVNGLPFDANGDGRLESDEPFQFGAILSGTSLQVQVNGLTIKTLTLANTSGTTGNGFAFLRNNLGGGGDATIGTFDNLTISGIPEPGTLVLAVSGLLGLLCYAWRKRK